MGLMNLVAQKPFGNGNLSTLPYEDELGGLTPLPKPVPDYGKIINRNNLSQTQPTEPQIQAQSQTPQPQEPELMPIPAHLAPSMEPQDDGLGGYGKPINLYDQALRAYRGDYGEVPRQKVQQFDWLQDYLRKNQMPAGGNTRGLMGLMGVNPGAFE